MTAWLALASLAVQMVVWFISATYIVGRAISKMEVTFTAARLHDRADIDQAIAEAENEGRDRLIASAREQRQTIESVARLISNDVNALRDRLHEHEITTRETFVRRDSFDKVADELKALFAKLEAKLDRLQERRGWSG